jgi:hypothetical protein
MVRALGHLATVLFKGLVFAVCLFVALNVLYALITLIGILFF